MTTTPIHIRRAKATDAEALAGIRRSAIRELAVPVMSAAQAEAWATQVPADRLTRAIEDHTVWVAEDEKALGWVEVDGDRIAALYVSPRRSSQGIGSALLLHAETGIQQAGYAIARLEASENALGFYLRRGYRRCGPPTADGAHPLRKELAVATLGAAACR